MSRKAVVIGGGISGLTIGYRLQQSGRFDVTVLEQGPVPGGKAQTDRIDGFTCERGTNSWLDNEPAARELIADLGISHRIEEADPASARRFIYRAPKLREIQMHPLKFLSSSIMPMGGKLRLAMEPMVSRRESDTDETLLAFATRRLGKSAADLLIGPMASGVYAGDPARMSLRSCFSKVYDLEQKYGSLIKGMVALKREKKQSGGNASEVQAGPSGKMTSLKGGISDLVEALEAELGDRLQTDCSVTGVRSSKDGAFSVSVSGGPDIWADILISAAPAHAAAAYLKTLDEDGADALGGIPYPALDVVCLGFKKEHVGHDLHGFGFLVPRGQNKTILGSLWTSSIFPGRAPEGHVLIRTMAGGMTEPQVAGWTEQQLLGTVRSDLADILHIAVDQTPAFQRVYRHKRAIPQYHVGHFQIVDRLRNAESRHPGLFISGNAIGGVGVVDCIRNASDLAGRITKHV